jgi:heme/copper-type cytochrome/quinol oxidase subunit 3
MEASASASAPIGPHIEPEPPEWQPRALWVGSRLLCGAASFFFMAFVFAYFYLRSLDTNSSWKIGAVNPSLGLGLAIAACVVLSAVVFRLGATRPTDTVGAGIVAILLALTAVGLQCFEYTKVGFGPASGGYASVFVGWTSLYALFALPCIFWMETQVASVWRAKREGLHRPIAEGVPADDAELMRSGLEAASFFWAFYAAIGVIAFIILYVV